MQSQDRLNGSVSRREVLTGSVAVLGGVGIGAGITAVAAPAVTDATAPPLPWPWVKLDPL